MGIAGIMAVFLAITALYAASVPPWNAPDEPAHYNYIRQLAEQHTLPVLVPGDYDFALLERLKAARFPIAEPVETIRYEGWQPPLYYALATPAYWATAGLPLAQRVFALRMVSALWGGLVLLAAYGILSRVLGKGTGLAAAAFIGTVPMFVFVSGSINNDTLGVLVLSTILWALIALPSADSRSTAGSFWHRHVYPLLGALLGLALLTKSTAYIGGAMVAAALLWPRPGEGWRSATLPAGLRRLALVYGTAALVSGWWFVRNIWVYGGIDFMARQRHDAVVTGQPLTGAVTGEALQNLGTTAFRSFWAQFGWMGVLVDQRLYLLFGVLSLMAALGAAWWGIKVRLGRESLTDGQARPMSILLLSGGLTMAGLAYYNLTFIQAQGRYLFPAMVPIAALFCLGLRQWVPRPSRVALASLWLVGMAGLDIFCLFRYILPDLVR